MTGNLINNYALFTSFARNQSLQTVILQRRDKTMDAVIAPCVSPLVGKGRFSAAKRFRCGAAVPWGAWSTRLKRGGTTSCLNPAVAGRLRPPPPGRRGRLQTSPPGPTLTGPPTTKPFQTARPASCTGSRSLVVIEAIWMGENRPRSSLVPERALMKASENWMERHRNARWPACTPRGRAERPNARADRTTRARLRPSTGAGRGNKSGS